MKLYHQSTIGLHITQFDTNLTFNAFYVSIGYPIEFHIYTNNKKVN